MSGAARIAPRPLLALAARAGDQRAGHRARRRQPAAGAAARSLEGAFGSAEGWSEVGVRTCPLLLTGLAVAVAFRAGIWNIGAEGQLLVGAIAVAWLGTRVGALPAWLAAAAGARRGRRSAAPLWAALAGVLKTTRNVDEVISTIMLNFIAARAGRLSGARPADGGGGQLSADRRVAAAVRLPRLFAGYRVHAGLLVALAAAALAYAAALPHRARLRDARRRPQPRRRAPRRPAHHARAARRTGDQRRPSPVSPAASRSAR